MNEPDTTLDQRFSAPDATAADWDETRRVLEEAQLSWNGHSGLLPPKRYGNVADV